MLLAEAGDMLNSGLVSVGAVVATPIEETVTAGGLTVAGRTYIMRAITYSTPFLCDRRCLIPSFCHCGSINRSCKDLFPRINRTPHFLLSPFFCDH